MNTNIWIIITEQKFKNTFLPDCQNKELTLDQLRGGIKLGVIKPSQIPKEIRKLLTRSKKLSDDSSKKRKKGLSEIPELNDNSDEYYEFCKTHWLNGERHIQPAIKLKVFSHYSKTISNYFLIRLAAIFFPIHLTKLFPAEVLFLEKLKEVPGRGP